MSKPTSSLQRGQWLEVVFIAPAALLSAIVFVGIMLWTLSLSFTSSRTFPIGHWVGLAQYRRLWNSERWITSVENLLAYSVASVSLSLTIGIALALLLDRKARIENALRTVFLYPYATPLIVTGLVWQWLLTPAIGVQAALKVLGWDTTFVWLASSHLAIYALALASVWYSAGLVMVIVLSAIKGLDQDLYRAARLDGVPSWRIYASIVLPQVRGAILASALLLTMMAVKTYDLVVAMTDGGPGTSTELPARFTMTYLFARQNIGLASASATTLLMGVALVFAAGLMLRRMRRR
jgi:glucose/mannose transport system permease protein